MQYEVTRTWNGKLFWFPIELHISVEKLFSRESPLRELLSRNERKLVHPTRINIASVKTPISQRCLELLNAVVVLTKFPS